FRNQIINDDDLNIFLKKKKLNEYYLIKLLSSVFCINFKSKHLKASLDDIFVELQIEKISDLSFYSISYTLSELTKDPVYLLNFCNNDNVKLEWKYLGMMELKKFENEHFKFDIAQKKIISRIKRKFGKGYMYLISELKKLNKLPKLNDEVTGSNLLEDPNAKI
ncbi:MAG: hypothetical protein SGI89_00640, partial [bacterium]|nr:hypothetical protein [bacterium]